MDNTFELTPKQAEYVKAATHRWNFAVGAVRSGKSHLAVLYTIPSGILARKGKKGLNLILGASRENIERNVLEPMRSIWGDTLVSDINNKNWATLFGEKVYCIGAENVRQVPKIRGSEIKFCYCDEICDINKEVFEMLKSRLSLSYSTCHAACNPSYPAHFVKQFIDTAERGVDIYYQHYTIYDNSFLPQEYVRSLELEYQGTVYYDRYILGNWTQAEGLIYPMFQEALKEIPSGTVDQYQMSLDYGTQNAFAVILWAKKDGVWYGIREYYYSGRETGMQKTDEEYLEAMEQRFEDAINACRRVGVKMSVIIDPSAASFITLLKKKADWAKIRKADNDVANGLRNTATCLKGGRICISPSMKAWRKEVEGYVWDETVDDRPIKENDHLMDAMRYFVQTNNIARPVRLMGAGVSVFL